MNRKLRRRQAKLSQDKGNFNVEAEMTAALGHYQAGRMDEAEAGFRQVLNHRPDNPHLLHLLGVLALGKGRHAEAVSLMERSVSLNADDAAAHVNLGVALMKQGGRRQDALSALSRAVALNPASADAHNNLGIVLKGMERLTEAVAAYRQAIALKPDYAEAFNNLGNALVAMGSIEEAVTSFEKAVALWPDYVEAHYNLGNTLAETGKPVEAVAALRRSLAIAPGFVEARSNLIYALDFDPGAGLAQAQQERRRWGELYARPMAGKIRPHGNDPDPERRLRVGYVSADFRRHSAAYIFAPALIDYDRSRFRAICYSNSAQEDDMTERFRDSTDGWRSIIGLSDDEAAELIRNDGIDILVDLSGHSRDNRLLLFARKPAPLQVTAWGHALGTGLETIDYLFADPIYVTEEEEKLYTEEIIHLPCVIAYSCPDDAPPVAPSPAASGKGVTFGYFNRMAKVSEQALDLWSAVLAAIPGASILIKNEAMSSGDQQRRIVKEFAARGVEKERIMMLGKTSWFEHLAAYGQVDMTFDPLTASGGASTMESLWMGAPVATIKGHMPSTRDTASILSALGLNDWIAETPGEFLEIVKAKAGDPAALARLRTSLRRRLAASPVGDSKAYAGAVDAAYRRIWRRWCGGITGT